MRAERSLPPRTSSAPPRDTRDSERARIAASPEGRKPSSSPPGNLELAQVRERLASRESELGLERDQANEAIAVMDMELSWLRDVLVERDRMIETLKVQLAELTSRHERESSVAGANRANVAKVQEVLGAEVAKARSITAQLTKERDDLITAQELSQANLEDFIERLGASLKSARVVQKRIGEIPNCATLADQHEAICDDLADLIRDARANLKQV